MPQTTRNQTLVGEVAIKAPVVVATTAAITLSGEQTIDGVAVVADDRVLVKDQADGIENGIYVADTGAWTRAPDCDGSFDLVEGSLIKANGGTANSGFWYCSTTGTIVVGTTSIAFAQASSTLAVISAFVQTLLDDATAAEFRTTLGSDTLTQNSQSTAYTTVLGDAGGHILHPTSDDNPRTFTIDSNANVAYPIGTTITFVNAINTVTIAITDDTLTLAGSGSTGSRTLAASGIATALKISSTSWIISGTGLS